MARPRIELTEFVPSPDLLPVLEQAGYDADHAIATPAALSGLLDSRIPLRKRD